MATATQLRNLAAGRAKLKQMRRTMTWAQIKQAEFVKDSPAQRSREALADEARKAARAARAPKRRSPRTIRTMSTNPIFPITPTQIQQSVRKHVPILQWIPTSAAPPIIQTAWTSSSSGDYGR